MKPILRTIPLALGLALAAGIATYSHAARQPRPARSCRENLRQLGAAMRRYLSDHERRLPPADRWAEELAPYLKGGDAWYCPQCSPRAHSYAMNRRVADCDAGDEKLWGKVLLFESGAGRKNAADAGESLCSPARHKGGNYFLLVDGRIVQSDTPPSF